MVREGFESSNTSKTRNNLYVWGLDRGLLFDAEDGGANGTRLAGVGLLIVAGVTPKRFMVDKTLCDSALLLRCLALQRNRV